MKKQFSVLSVSAMIIGLTASSFGTALISDAAPADKNQNSYKEVPKPMPAANVKIAKKIPVSLAIREIKDKPATPPGQNKNNDDFSERAATGFLSAPLASDAKKYAVVIGICDYPGTGNDICSSDGDSYNMVKALIENYGYSPGDIYWFRDMGEGTITIGEGEDKVEVNYRIPNHENIREAVIGTKDAEDIFTGGIKDEAISGDEVVFFFSGHGASGIVDDGTVGGENDEEETDEAIIVHDSDKLIDGDGYATLDFIWDGELRSWFYGFETERIIFMFDTCLAGGMNDVVNDEYDEIYSDRVVVMSSKETQSSYVYSYGEFGEGMFSRHFVNEGMLQGLADKYFEDGNHDGDVVIEEAFDYAKENIPPYLKRRQSPVISDEFENDLIL